MGMSTSESAQQQGAASDAPPKKYQRSQSPRAKERRRLQNRIAQRNHRRRLKEQSLASSKEGSSEPPEAQEMTTLPSPQPSGSTPPDLQAFLSMSPPRGIDTVMGDDMSGKTTPPWPTLDQMMPPLPGADTANPFFFSPLPQACTCNSMTGPCARHLEEIRMQFFNNTMSASPRSMLPFAKSPTPVSSFEGSPGLPALAFDASTPGALNITLPQSAHGVRPRASYQSTSSASSTSTSSPNPQLNASSNPRPIARHRTGSGVSKRSTPPPLNSASVMSSTPPTSEDGNSLSSVFASSPEVDASHYIKKQSPNTHNPHMNHTRSNSGIDPASTNDTQRFNKILEAVRAAGFSDFDRMVAAYYTANFEKSSVPDMSQRASRGRRLAKVLKEVHESSVRWPRWEAKGFRESAMEFAKKVCVEEIEKVAQHSARSREGTDHHSSAMAIDSANGEERRLLAQLTTLPDDVEAAVQDEAPFLWTLFTELAGPQSLYCDRVSQAVLALLIDGRRTQ